MAQIKLNSEAARGKILAEVANLPVDAGYFVSISTEEERRRLSQNSLYWVWVAAISQQTGYSKEEMHTRLKRSILAPVYYANPVGSAQTAWALSMVTIQKLLKDADQMEARDTTIKIKQLVSTTWATIKQFSEYLRDTEQMCMSRQIRLPYPDDYKEAIS